MSFKGWIIAGAVLAAGAVSVGTSAQPVTPGRPPVRATPAEPVVVELFTAQGCSGCPAANRVVEALAQEPGVIALTYAVDYWDYLGWPDTFARPEFAQRQRAYLQAMQLRGVYTPQVIIDGRRQLSGARRADVQQAVDQEAERRVFPPQIEFREAGDRVGVGSGTAPEGGAEVWAVTYRPGPQSVTVNGGDNRGRVVRHVNVVRSLSRLGAWTGRPVLYDLPEAEAGEAVAVLVQARADRRILTAATL
ncbi:DUF1223 domain-containing protein [Brevundimonas sp.]|jgi:hypothetical protein|uniref:DUF1223 domain-containing protein n=1 Tax=Brevundimonas sp. TaxID=1871086 RepID=UPI003784E628